MLLIIHMLFNFAALIKRIITQRLLFISFTNLYLLGFSHLIFASYSKSERFIPDLSFAKSTPLELLFPNLNYSLQTGRQLGLPLPQ